MDSPSASPLDVSADVVVARLRTRPASASSRAETSVTSFAVSSTKRWRSGVSRLTSCSRRLDDDERRVEVVQRGVRLVLRAGLEVAQELDGLRDAGARLRVERVEDLVEVDGGLGARRRERVALVDVGLIAAAELQVDVAVGDARQRRLADDRAGAAAQRVVAVARRSRA